MVWGVMLNPLYEESCKVRVGARGGYDWSASSNKFILMVCVSIHLQMVRWTMKTGLGTACFPTTQIWSHLRQIYNYDSFDDLASECCCYGGSVDLQFKVNLFCMLHTSDELDYGC